MVEPTDECKDPGRAPIGRGDLLAITLILAVAFLLRFLWSSWLPGLNGDEAGWGRLSQRLMDGRRTWAESYMADRGPIFGLFQMPGITLLGNEPEGVRFSTALAGTALAFLVWLLLMRRGERRWARFAAVWIALDPLLVGWSRIGMEIMLLPALNTLTLLLLMEHHRAPSRFALPAGALCASIAMQMHPLESVFLGCLGIALFVSGMWRPVVFSRAFRGAALIFIITFPPHLHWLRSAKPELMLVNSREIRPAPEDPVGHVKRMIEEGPGLVARLRHFAGCLDGTRIAEYLSGEPLPALAGSSPFKLLFGMLLVLAPITLLRRPDPFMRMLVIGMLCGAILSLLVSFYTNTSQEVPGHERYVLLLLVPWWPLVVTASLAGEGALERSRKALAGAGILVLAGMTTVTIDSLLLPFHVSGGHGDVPFVTNRGGSPIESAARMLGAMRGVKGVRVLSQDLHLKEGIDFILRESVEIETLPYFPGPDADAALAAVEGSTWIAALAETDLGRYLEQRLHGKHHGRVEFLSRDGRPVVVAYEIRSPSR